MKKVNKHSKKAVYYDNKMDVLWFKVRSGVEEEHREIAPGVSIELNKQGDLLGIEILNASHVLGKKFDKKTPAISSAISHKI